MAKTGLIIKYRWFYQETTHGSIMKIGFFTISDQSLRRLHSDYSLYFTIIIGLMMITGIYLYLYPKLAARERDKETSNEPQTNNPKM